jgi:hypothetical protein
MTQTNVISEAIPGEQLATERAYQTIYPEFASVPDDELVPISIDVMGVVTTVIGVLPELRALRVELEAALRTFDFVRFDKLEDYALALSYANTLHRAALAPKREIIEMANELTGIRDRFLENARSLASHAVLDGERLKECKTANGYRALVSDVFILVEVFKGNWSAVEGKTPITPAALQNAGNLGLDLLAAVGQKDQGPVLIGEATLTRQRAFTLLVRTYEDTRRAVQYVRGKQGDADEIIPSLYAGRGPRRRVDDDAEAPITPVATSVGMARATSPVLSPAHPEGAPIHIDNSAGFPLDSPFIS